MASTSKTNDKLATLLQRLPQELIDAIYTFTNRSITHCKRQIEISSGYSPSAALHISRSTRNSFAAQYYSKTVFHSRKQCLITRWLASLPPEHRKLLSTVRYIRIPTPQQDKGACASFQNVVRQGLLSEEIEVEDLGFLTVWT